MTMMMVVMMVSVLCLTVVAVVAIVATITVMATVVAMMVMTTRTLIFAIVTVVMMAMMSVVTVMMGLGFIRKQTFILFLRLFVFHRVFRRFFIGFNFDIAVFFLSFQCYLAFMLVQRFF